jgi:hypothetical protein
LNYSISLSSSWPINKIVKKKEKNLSQEKLTKQIFTKTPLNQNELFFQEEMDECRLLHVQGTSSRGEIKK